MIHQLHTFPFRLPFPSYSTISSHTTRTSARPATGSQWRGWESADLQDSSRDTKNPIQHMHRKDGAAAADHERRLQLRFASLISAVSSRSFLIRSDTSLAINTA